MIRFLRNLRRKIISLKGIKKYLLYALGEIVLVVIGILVALQINNWNEYQKDRNREKMYLESLEGDLRESQDELERVIDKTNRVKIAALQLLEYSTDTVPMPPPAVFDSLVITTFGYTIAMTNEGTINDITGSGDLKVIRNDSLRSMIASWEAGFKMIRERENLLKVSYEENKKNLQNKVDLYSYEINDHGLTTQLTRELITADLLQRNGLFTLVINSNRLNQLYREKIKSLDTMIAITSREIRELD